MAHIEVNFFSEFSGEQKYNLSVPDQKVHFEQKSEWAKINFKVKHISNCFIFKAEMNVPLAQTSFNWLEVDYNLNFTVIFDSFWLLRISL